MRWLFRANAIPSCRRFRGDEDRIVVCPAAHAARDLDVVESTLRRWMQELTSTPITAFSWERADLAEIAALKKGAARPRAEHDILKKAVAFSCARPYEVRLRRQVPPHLIRRLAVRRSDVSRSGFYSWLNRPFGAHEIHDARLVVTIETIFKASDPTYGACRIWRDVLEKGFACGLHRIEQLMQINALRARPKRRGKPKDDGERSVIADGMLLFIAENRMYDP